MKLRGFEFDKVVGLIVKGGMMGMTHAQGLYHGTGSNEILVKIYEISIINHFLDGFGS